MKHLIFLFFFYPLVVSAVSANRNADKYFRFDIEGALAWQALNRNQVPNSDLGTRFDLADFKKSAIFAPRFYLTYQVRPSHSLKAMVFPFQTEGIKTFDSDVNFDGVNFVSGQPITGKYRFHSYRLTYQYEFLKNDSWILKAGFTAKIRNALIALSQNSTMREYSNVGFVPLLNFNARYLLSSDWRLEFDMDALAAPQGRAEDITFQGWYSLSPDWEFGVGYRTLEGGADNSKVYTFAWFHFLTFIAAYNW
jgi:hypothetical protein